MSTRAVPTPVERLSALSRARTSLWIKRDDLTHPVYGGNKVRKLERLLADAAAQGARELVTVGAVGSNHVLATGIFARERGLRVTAVVLPQPSTPHVLENMRACVGVGIALVPVRSRAVAAFELAKRVAGGAYYLPPGGSNVIGAGGFVAAGRELAEQVRQGALPMPDTIVVALGSGGTAAGLLAGVSAAGLATRIVAVTVAEPAWLVEHRARALAVACSNGRLEPSDVARRLEHDRRYLGGGYGHATAASERAVALALRENLVLEQTYTAKAFAAALARVAAGTERTILYWHTLSSAPLTPFVAQAPPLAALDPALLRLLEAP